MPTIRPPARRGRPPRISQDQIVQAAIELGLDSFSMRGIAERLSVTPPALYSHVAGRGEVLDLVDAALRRRLSTFRSDATDWRGWFLDFATVVRGELAGSPTAALQGIREVGPTGSLGMGERGLELLIEGGLSPTEAGYAMWLVYRVAVTAGTAQRASFDGFVADTEAALRAHTVGDPATSDAALPGGGTADLPDAAIPETAIPETAIPAADLDHTRAVQAALASRPQDTFEFDLRVVLDGIAARLDAARPTPGRDEARDSHPSDRLAIRE